MQIRIPGVDTKALGLTHPYIVVQLLIEAQDAFSFELEVLDTKRTKRRLIFSTNFKDSTATALHAQIPLGAPRLALRAAS